MSAANRLPNAYLGCQMTWFATATLALLIATIELAIRANLAQEHRVSSATLWVLLGAYGVFTLGWILRLVAKFQSAS